MQNDWKYLIRPRRLEVAELTDTYGKFIAEPLERGYGTTIGNSLRRVLLSSLKGAAITSVRFKGVQHEFTSISGVKEDILDIILNLKQVRFKMLDIEEATLQVRCKGEGNMTGRDLACNPSVEVLNPDCHVATLLKDAEVEAEINLRVGKGYLPADNNREEDSVEGTIPVDSIFTPITRVAYSVTQARVGRQTDYDKLTIEVWTTGAIGPQDAIADAAAILSFQLNLFVTFEEEVEPIAESDAPESKYNENLFKTVDELELSVRSANCLKNADIKYLGELVQKTEQEMLKTKNFGRKSLNEIKEIIGNMGLQFGISLKDFPSREDLDNMHPETKSTL